MEDCSVRNGLRDSVDALLSSSTMDSMSNITMEGSSMKSSRSSLTTPSERVDATVSVFKATRSVPSRTKAALPSCLGIFMLVQFTSHFVLLVVVVRHDLETTKMAGTRLMNG